MGTYSKHHSKLNQSPCLSRNVDCITFVFTKTRQLNYFIKKQTNADINQSLVRIVCLLEKGNDNFCINLFSHFVAHFCLQIPPSSAQTRAHPVSSLPPITAHLRAPVDPAHPKSTRTTSPITTQHPIRPHNYQGNACRL